MQCFKLLPSVKSLQAAHSCFGHGKRHQSQRRMEANREAALFPLPCAKPEPLYSKITSNFTKVDGVTVLFQLAAAAEDPAIRTALSPLPASLWRSSRDINPSFGTAIRSLQTEQGKEPRISPRPHNSPPACAGSRRCSHKPAEAHCLAFVPH